MDPNEAGDWKGLDQVLAYVLKRRAVLQEEAPVILGELQGEGEVLRVAWTRQGLHGEGGVTTSVKLEMYSTFTFAAERIIEHVVARDYGAFLMQVKLHLSPCDLWFVPCDLWFVLDWST